MSYRRQLAPAHMISPDSLLAHPHRYFFLKIRKQRLREVKRLPHSHTALIPAQGGGGEYGTPSWVLSAMSKKTSLKDPRPITQVVNSLSILGRGGGEATLVALVRDSVGTLGHAGTAFALTSGSWDTGTRTGETGFTHSSRVICSLKSHPCEVITACSQNICPK